MSNKFVSNWFFKFSKLNDKTFQDSLFSVSLARPKAQFNRNNSYSSGYERSNSGTFSQNFNQNSGQNTTSASNISSSPSKVTGSGSQGGWFDFVEIYLFIKLPN